MLVCNLVRALVLDEVLSEGEELVEVFLACHVRLKVAHSASSLVELLELGTAPQLLVHPCVELGHTRHVLGLGEVHALVEVIEESDQVVVAKGQLVPTLLIKTLPVESRFSEMVAHDHDGLATAERLAVP